MKKIWLMLNQVLSPNLELLYQNQTGLSQQKILFFTKFLKDKIPILKREYFAGKVNLMVKNFFNDSPAQFASFFTKETGLTDKELESLKSIIDVQLKSKKP